MDTFASPSPCVSITALILSFNARDLTLACLQSLQAQSDPPEHIIVVDNASSDDSVAAIREHFPQVELIISPQNLGFAGGNNLGLARVRTSWVLLVNNDATLANDAVAALRAAAMNAAPQVGALTARVLLAEHFRRAAVGTGIVGPTGSYTACPDGDVVLVNSTGNQIDRRGFGLDRGWLAEDGTHQPAPDVFGFCGNGALLRMSALTEVGYFDPDFFLYYEDSDLSWRLRRAGFTVEYVGGAVLRHQHSASSVAGSQLFRYYNERNRLLLLLKHGWLPRALGELLFFAIRTVGGAILRPKTQLSRTSARLRAWWGAVVLLPRMLARRHQINRTARTSARAVRTYLVKAHLLH